MAFDRSADLPPLAGHALRRGKVVFTRLGPSRELTSRPRPRPRRPLPDEGRAGRASRDSWASPRQRSKEEDPPRVPPAAPGPLAALLLVLGLLGPPLPRGYHLGAPAVTGREDPVNQDEIAAWVWDKRGQALQQLERPEDHVGRTVIPGPLQRQGKPTVRQLPQALERERRARGGRGQFYACWRGREAACAPSAPLL